MASNSHGKSGFGEPVMRMTGKGGKKTGPKVTGPKVHHRVPKVPRSLMFNKRPGDHK